MAKSKSRKVSERTKTAIVLGKLATKRLGSACVALECTQSELVEELINTYLKDYTVQAPPEGERIKVTRRERKAKPAKSAPTLPAAANARGPEPAAGATPNL